MNLCEICNKKVSQNRKLCGTCSNLKRWANPNDPRRQKLIERNQSVREGNLPYTVREWIRSRYEDQQLSLRKIAKEAGCGLRTIARWMQIHSIPTRDVKELNRSRKQTGSANPNWRGYARVIRMVRSWATKYWRPLILERDKDRCRYCNSEKHLHAHHIETLSSIVREQYNAVKPDLSNAEKRHQFAQQIILSDIAQSVDNGILLCKSCHKKVHETLKPKRSLPKHVSPS